MTEFKRYSGYKDSEVEWLGEIPADWNTAQVRDFFTERRERNDLGQNANYLSLMANRGIIPYAEKGNVGNKMPEDLSKTKKIYAGDFVINSMNYGIGSFGDSVYDGVCSSVYVVLTPRTQVYDKFAYLLLSNMDVARYAQSFGKGILAHRCAIGWDILKGLGMPLPPLETQHQIVKFLDSETAHIDAGIANMESLIALLTEKRSALISETVTRGIPGEHTEFKDSGIDWLGEIPVAWSVNRLKQFATAVKRPAVEGQENITAFRNGRVTLRKNVRATGYTEADKEHGYQSIHKNDLVIHNMDAFAGAIGVSDAYGKSTPVYTVCEVKENASPMFLAYALRIMAWEGWILSLSRGIRERSTDFRWAASSNQCIPSPSKEEQERIVHFIEKETEKLDLIINEAKQSISLLKEKRQTLISDVVTGKIDVRNNAN